MRFQKFIKLYGLIHVVAYIFFNLVIIILQIVLTVAFTPPFAPSRTLPQSSRPPSPSRSRCPSCSRCTSWSSPPCRSGSNAWSGMPEANEEKAIPLPREYNLIFYNVYIWWTFGLFLKALLFIEKLLFRQYLDKSGYFLFKHLVTLRLEVSGACLLF